MSLPFAPALSRASTPGKLACRAKTLLALALLMPLAACASQPAQPAEPAQQDSSAVTAPAARPAAPARDQAAAPPAEAAAPARPAPAPVTSAGTAAGTAAAPAQPPAAERTTTVGDVPAAVATPEPAAGAPATPAATPGTPASPAPIQVGQASAAPSTGTLLQTILALVLVLALLGALAWAAKRYGPKMTGSSANLRMVGALNIGGRERILVVEVGDQWIVVGASPGRVNALATMPKGEAAQGTATLAGHTPSAASFGDWLKQTIDKRNAK